MLRKSLFLAGFALATVLVMAPKAESWGAYHVGYTHYGPYTGFDHYGSTGFRAGSSGGYGGFHYGGYHYGGYGGYRGYHYGYYRRW